MVVSGGAYRGEPPESAGMAAAAIALGVKPEDVLQDSHSLDTDDEARLIAPMVGTAPLLLVTSAAHMPRAMLLFRHYGMHPTAAPSDYLAGSTAAPEPGAFYPNAGSLLQSEFAFHENLGTVWAWLHGRH
ncbi:MAG: YdcF family protein [Terriglobales bacterium]